MKFLRNFIFLLLAIYVLLGCSKELKPFRVASNIWIGYEPLYAAEHFKLTEQPLELYKKNNATEVMEMYEQGLLDAACLTLDEAMLLIEKGVNVNFAAVLDISNGADQFVALDGINKLSEIKGKKIGVETTALGRLMLNGVLAEANLTINDVIVVDATVDEHYELMANGQIDAAVTFPPFSKKLKELSVNTLYNSSQMKAAPIVDVLVVTDEAKQYKYEQIGSLISAITKVNQKIENKDSEILAFIGKNLGVAENEWHAMTNGVRLMESELNLNYLHRYKLEATMLILEEVMLKNKMLNSSIKGQIKPDMFMRF